MLLSLKQEIDYIRATVTGLGIATEALPEPLPLDDSANDPTLKDVMINLAEHRGVLRKIPFKPQCCISTFQVITEIVNIQRLAR